MEISVFSPLLNKVYLTKNKNNLRQLFFSFLLFISIRKCGIIFKVLKIEKIYDQNFRDFEFSALKYRCPDDEIRASKSVFL